MGRCTGSLGKLLGNPRWFRILGYEQDPLGNQGPTRGTLVSHFDPSAQLEQSALSRPGSRDHQARPPKPVQLEGPAWSHPEVSFCNCLAELSGRSHDSKLPPIRVQPLVLPPQESTVGPEARVIQGEPGSSESTQCGARQIAECECSEGTAPESYGWVASRGAVVSRSRCHGSSRTGFLGRRRGPARRWRSLHRRHWGWAFRSGLAVGVLYRQIGIDAERDDNGCGVRQLGAGGAHEPAFSTAAPGLDPKHETETCGLDLRDGSVDREGRFDEIVSR